VARLYPQALGAHTHTHTHTPVTLLSSVLTPLQVTRTILPSVVLLIIPLHGPNRKHRFQPYLCCCMRMLCRWNVFIEPFPSNSHSFLLGIYGLPTDVFLLFRCRCLEVNDVSEPFSSNSCFSASRVLALSKYTTISYFPYL
jgi:hypothetical protein